MDAAFYNLNVLRSYAGEGGRVVLFCFSRAAGIMLDRLIEANRPEADFAGVYIVSLPWPDVISRAGGRDDIAAELRKTGITSTQEDLNAQCQRKVYNLYRRFLYIENSPADSGAAARPFDEV